MPCSPTKGHCALPIPLVGYWVLGPRKKSSVYAGRRGASVTPSVFNDFDSGQGIGQGKRHSGSGFEKMRQSPGNGVSLGTIASPKKSVKKFDSDRQM